MAEERKDSFAETVDTAASAAHTVKGAIKAGKAISGAAKGAAAGGPYSSTTIRKGDYLKSASVMHGITITYENEVLAVTLPSLLPKRRQRQSAEFLLDPLYFALEQYAKENTLPHYRECVVCFAQVYDQALPTRRVRDYDNLEEKQILDLLSSFVMADDTGLLCDAYNTAELGEQDCTMIFVMEKHRFPGWLAEHKSSLKSISDF